MILLSELRIGNWILEAGEPSQVYSLDRGGISFCQINDIRVSKKTGLVQMTDEDRFNHLSLCPEILEKCNFREEERFFIDYNKETYNQEKKAAFWLLKKDSLFSIQVNYLDQVQNLYFFLTRGQELEVTL